MMGHSLAQPGGFTMRFAVLVLALLLSASANAQQLDPWQLVGHTTTAHQGGEGVRTFTLACQADYGSAARMCTSEEVLNTIVWPTLTEAAWVRPTIVSSSTDGIVDASGIKQTRFYLSCQGWGTTSSGLTGLTVNPGGGLKAYDDLLTNVCSIPKPVACCRRVPEPTASLMLPVGGLACLGLAKARG
jgi:hypothetical protein